VPREQIDPRYFEAPYYIAPEDPIAYEAFTVIRDAMREEGKTALARVVISRRERIVLLEPLGKGIMATVLRYANEVRSEQPYFEDIPDLTLPAEMRDLAGHIIESRSSDFDPSKFEDRYESAVLDLIKSKQTGEPVPAPTIAPPSTVVNLMDALRRSIAAEQAPAQKAPSKLKSERAVKQDAKPRPSAKKAG
jgi:DNA end-binding protein Ku